MYFVLEAARLVERGKPDVLKLTMPPVSVSHTWPRVTDMIARTPLLCLRLTSL